jgi:hypothetical protein
MPMLVATREMITMIGNESWMVVTYGGEQSTIGGGVRSLVSRLIERGATRGTVTATGSRS